MIDHSEEHDTLLQTLIQSIAKVFSPNDPSNIFVLPPVPETIGEQNPITSYVSDKPQDYNTPPH